MIMDRAAVCAGCPNVATADERRSFSPGDTMTNVAGGILLGPAAAGRRRRRAFRLDPAQWDGGCLHRELSGN